MAFRKRVLIILFFLLFINLGLAMKVISPYPINSGNGAGSCSCSVNTSGVGWGLDDIYLNNVSGIITFNTSALQIFTDVLYSPITEPIAVSVNNSWKANYTDWNSSGWIKDWSFQAENQSWNESRANLLYSSILEPIAVSVNNSWKANYTDWNSSGWIKDWSFQAENQSWNESRANLLYASSGIYITCSGTGMISSIQGSGSACSNFNELDPVFSFFWVNQTRNNILSTSLIVNSSQNAFFNDFTLSSDETEASFDEYNKPTVTYSKIPGVTGSTTIALFSETPTALNFVSGGTAGNDGGVVLAGNTGSTTSQIINSSKFNKFSIRFKDLSAHNRRELWGLFYTLTATDLTSNKTGVFFWLNGTDNYNNYTACVCNGGRPKTDLMRCECSVSPIQNDTNWHTFEITGNQRYNYTDNSLNTAWTFAIDKDKITNVPVWNKTITPTVTQTPALVSSLGVWFEPTANNITNISIDWSYYEFKR